MQLLHKIQSKELFEVFLTHLSPLLQNNQPKIYVPFNTKDVIRHFKASFKKSV